jgi:hypothetical protein
VRSASLDPTGQLFASGHDRASTGRFSSSGLGRGTGAAVYLRGSSRVLRYLASVVPRYAEFSFMSGAALATLPHSSKGEGRTVRADIAHLRRLA